MIADAKRGDFPGSARAYEQALFGGIATPYGAQPGPRRRRRDAEPAARAATRSRRSSTARARPARACSCSCARRNPGAADLFDAELAAGGPLWEQIAGLVAAAGTPGPESGLAEVGAVTGATAPQHLARMRELMPHAPFLLPGIGAQGGSVADLAPAFAPGRAGGLVSASRSIADAHEARRRRARRGRARRGRAAARARPGRSAERRAPSGRAGTPGIIERDGRTQPRALPRAARAGGLRAGPVRRRLEHDQGRRRRAGRAGHLRARGGDAGAERQEEARAAKTYTIKSGDTPSGIAVKVGVPLDQILELNPDLDPQTLTPGTKIKLR